jgi:CheY-like chemotaxis protein
MLDYKSEASLLIDFEGDVLLSNAPFDKLSGYDESTIPELHIRQLLLTMEDDQNPLDQKQLREFKKTMYLLNISFMLTKVDVELSEIEGQKFLCIVQPAQEQLKPAVETGDLRSINLHPENSKVLIPSSPEIGSEWTAEQQHNIRTALNGIMGFASMLQQESLIISEDRLKTYVGNIRKNGSRLIKLIEPEQNQNTLFSRKVNLSVFDPLTIIKKLINKYSDEALFNDLLFKTSEIGNTKLLTDQGIFEHILEYFFQKAVLFCRNKVILIKLENLKADLLRIEIDNIGQDLPDSIRKWLDEQAEYQPYMPNSAVLDDDLSFRNLIHSLNKLDASLKLSRGTSGGDIACLLLTSVVEKPEIDVELGLMETIKLHKPSILVVEDERINAQIISVYLKDLGEVTIAYTGNEAINLIRQHEIVGSVFDIIIMDIGLPEPWNGVTLKEYILNSWSHYRKAWFIVQTAYVHEDWTSFIESGQFAGFLTKPINRLELLFMINKLLK